MYHHWAFARSTKVDPNQTSTPFTEPTQESNFIFFFFFFLLFYFTLGSFQQKKKKKRKPLLSFELQPERNKKGWSDRSRARRSVRCVNRHVRSCSELSTFRNEKDFGLVNKQDFNLDFSGSVGFFEGKSAGRSTGRPSKSLSASCTTFLSKKKKKTTIGQSKNPRTVRKKKILAGTPELERVTKDERSSLFSAQESAWPNKAGSWSGCPVSNPDPNNTIGLFSIVRTLNNM